MNIIHETSLVVLRNEAELVVSNLLISRDIYSIVVVTITVHIVGSHERIVVTAAPCLINKTVVVAALVVTSDRSHETVRSNILRVVQLDVVRALVSRHVSEGRLCVATRHTGDFLRNRVSISSHDAYPVSRLHVNSNVGSPTVTLAGVLEDESTGIRAEILRIDRAVVCAVETRETTDRRNTPVGQCNSVYCLVEDTLNSYCEWEADRESIIKSERSLPDLRHLEMRVNGRYRRRNSAFIRRDSLRITKRGKFILQGLDGSLAVDISYQTTSELTHREAISSSV